MVQRIKTIKCYECPYFRSDKGDFSFCLLLDSIRSNLSLHFGCYPVDIRLKHYRNFPLVRRGNDDCLIFERLVINDD